MRDTTRLPLTRELHRMGFAREGTDRDPLLYTKVVGARKLDVQLWKDGNHRVSHWIDGVTPLGRMCTVPTPFHTVDEMRAAFDIELTRTDHPAPIMGPWDAQ